MRTAAPGVHFQITAVWAGTVKAQACSKLKRDQLYFSFPPTSHRALSPCVLPSRHTPQQGLYPHTTSIPANGLLKQCPARAVTASGYVHYVSFKLEEYPDTASNTDL